jgi:EmrB/QacA subfamily drug resistance transporter
MSAATTQAANHATRIAWVVAGAFFMETLDSTIIVTVLPAIAASYGVSALDASLGVTVYLVAMAMGIPAAGWLALRLGARRVFLAAVAVFTATSLLCALAPNFETFVGFRFAQGLAAAFMSPMGRLVVLSETPKPRIIEALGLITWPGLIAPVLGPPLGGLIVTYAPWQWIFLINVPLGLLAIGLILWLFPSRQAERPDAPLDGWGLLWTMLSLACLVLGVTMLSESSGGLWVAAVLVTVGIATGCLALRHARRHADPILDLRPFGVRSYAIAGGSAGLLSRIAINASPFLLPLMFQIGFGWSALQAGSMVIAYMAGNLAMKAVTTPILRKFRFKTVLLTNGVLCTACLFAMAALTARTPAPVMMILLVVAGMTRSMNFTGVTTLAFADIPDALRAHASALATMLQQVAIVFGVALAAFVLGLSRTVRSSDALRLVDFQVAWLLVGACMALSLFLMRRLPADAGYALATRPGGSR